MTLLHIPAAAYVCRKITKAFVAQEVNSVAFVLERSSSYWIQNKPVAVSVGKLLKHLLYEW